MTLARSVRYRALDELELVCQHVRRQIDHERDIDETAVRARLESILRQLAHANDTETVT